MGNGVVSAVRNREQSVSQELWNAPDFRLLHHKHFCTFDTSTEAWDAKLAQWTVAFAFKPEDLSSVPRTCMVGGKNLTPASLSSNFHTDAVTLHVYIHTHTKLYTQRHTQVKKFVSVVAFTGW